MLAQGEAVAGDEVAALRTLLTEMPLRERVRTLDAELLNAPVTQDIQAQGGDYLGLVKSNHGKVKAVLDDRVGDDVFSP